jgi:hypothetical protein
MCLDYRILESYTGLLSVKNDILQEEQFLPSKTSINISKYRKEYSPGSKVLLLYK